MFNVYREELLEERLKRLTESVAGIEGAVIVSVEGFVVAAYAPQEHGHELVGNTPQVAAMSATLMALGEQTLSRLAQGKIARLLVEGEAGAMIVYPINKNAALAALVNKSAKMGLSLMAVSRAATIFADILDGST